MNREEMLKVLRQIKHNDGALYGIIGIGLFGSFARNTARDNSDVDICIKTQTPDPYILVHIKDD